jgi:hypothetical protein
MRNQSNTQRLRCTSQSVGVGGLARPDPIVPIDCIARLHTRSQDTCPTVFRKHKSIRTSSITFYNRDMTICQWIDRRKWFFAHEVAESARTIFRQIDRHCNFSLRGPNSSVLDLHLLHQSVRMFDEAPNPGKRRFAKQVFVSWLLDQVGRGISVSISSPFPCAPIPLPSAVVGGLASTRFMRTAAAASAI